MILVCFAYGLSPFFLRRIYSAGFLFCFGAKSAKRTQKKTFRKRVWNVFLLEKQEKIKK